MRADQSLLRYQRVLQRYRSAAGGPSARVSAAGSVLSLAPAGEGVSNISSRNALAGVGGSSGSLEVASSGGVRESREGAAAQAAANEEEALILRAFDAGTMLPRQSRRWRMSPVVYRAYLGACTGVCVCVCFRVRCVLLPLRWMSACGMLFPAPHLLSSLIHSHNYLSILYLSARHFTPQF